MALSPPSTNSKMQSRPASYNPSTGAIDYGTNPATGYDNGTVTGSTPGSPAQYVPGNNAPATSPVNGTPLPTGPAKGTLRNAPETLPAGGIGSGGYTNTSAGAADEFKKNMPGYIENQVSGAQDTARANLANDIQSAKASANARGLLYSGQESAGEDAARANQGSQLASNIQGINKDALSQLGTLQNNAVTEAAQQGANATQMAALQAQASQTAYEQALQEQQAQDQYYSQMAGGILSIAGTGAGLAAKAL